MNYEKLRTMLQFEFGATATEEDMNEIVEIVKQMLAEEIPQKTPQQLAHAIQKHFIHVDIYMKYRTPEAWEELKQSKKILMNWSVENRKKESWQIDPNEKKNG